MKVRRLNIMCYWKTVFLKATCKTSSIARLMEVKPTGNGVESPMLSYPIPRMTNTYMLAGQHSPEEIIASIDRGISPNLWWPK